MDSAFKVIVKENKVLEVKPSKGKNGTHIVVKNLFENFPVRKNFFLMLRQKIIILKKL